MDERTRRAADATRRLSFASVAEQYDQMRPPYPEKLVDDVLAYAGLAHGGRALEVGAGTGQATAQFASRGLSVHAIEPSAEMVALARDRFDGSHLKVTFEAADFESAVLPEEPFDLVFAATSWHWLEPRRRWELVLEALNPGGTVAAFWHWPLWRRSSQLEALDAVYRASGVDLTQMGPMLEVTPELEALAGEWFADAPDPDAFDGMRGVTYSWTESYSSIEYASLLGTYADHLTLAPDVREPLLTAVVDVVDAAGGRIDLPYQTFLLLARASD
jgi:SAM-dependent methyltransferase